MVERKGQAAMEFLMTYGWALLVVLVAIGALAFFGVLNPGQFLPSSCTITPGIACTDFNALENNTVTVVLQNGMGESMANVAITMPDTASCNAGALNCVGPTTLADGATDAWACTCTVDILKGEKFKTDVVVSYDLGGDNPITHSKTGQLVTQVEA